MKKAVQSGHKSKIAIAVVCGIAISCLISLLISLIGSALIARGVLGENRYGILCVICWVCSAAAGSITVLAISKPNKLSICFITVIGYLFLLIGNNVLFFDGIFQSLWKGIILSLTGMIAVFYIIAGKKGSKKRKISYRTK